VELFVGNIPYAYTEQDITDLFADCGRISYVRMMMDRKTNRFRGFAFIKMETEAGERAALALHDTMVDAKNPNQPVEDDGWSLGHYRRRRRGPASQRKLIVLPARNNRRFRPRRKKMRKVAR
jgi:RNA recognition motif-containing protein